MNDLWEQIQERIKKEITAINYAIWMHSIDKVLETEDVIILQSPNRHFTEHVQKNYLSTIVRILKEFSGRQYTIQFQEEVEQNHSAHTNNSKTTKSKQINIQSENRINPNKKFSNFVVGPCNQFVHAIAKAVSDQPGDSQYNPLFIYGPTGLGKTHLLYAIANKIQENNPKKSVLYIHDFRDQIIL